MDPLLEALVQVLAATHFMQQIKSNYHRKALLQSSEQHRQRFRSLTPSDVGHLTTFEFVQMLQHNCEKWLLADCCDVRRIVEKVAMEQFVARLPEEISNCVQQHLPATLTEAIQMAEIYLASFSLPTIQMRWTECFIMEIMQCLEALKQQQVESKDLKKVLQWSDQHRQRFRSLTLSEVGHPFLFAQQLLDCCQKWLLAEAHDPRQIVKWVVMEQFIKHLPEGTAHWVQHHQPTTLNEAIHLSESHHSYFSPIPHLPK